LFVYALSLAVFAQGTSEFMLSGLVPGIARDMSVGVAAAASLTSAYAVGMVVGAPVMAALSARWPRRRALAIFLVAFVVVHVIGAVTRDFAVLFGTRVVAAVANAGFLAVAMSTVSTVVGPARQNRATATLLAGVTIACVVGVPGGAFLGQFYGWRSAFWAVAALSLPALLLVFRSAPAEAADCRHVSVRTEFGAVKDQELRRTLVFAALVNGATFATFAFLAVVATDVAGMPGGAVPALLAAFGIGAFVGVTVAGWDGGLFRVASTILPFGWLVLAVVSTYPVALFVMALVQGALSFGVGSALIARVVRVARDAPSLGGSFATAALNLGAFLGPVVAGVVTGATGDYRHAIWLSVALTSVLLPFRGGEAQDLRVVDSGR
jgi:DHA1 family chloramphenicol resistance protein-like MFS transporter